MHRLAKKFHSAFTLFFIVRCVILLHSLVLGTKLPVTAFRLTSLCRQIVSSLLPLSLPFGAFLISSGKTLSEVFYIFSADFRLLVALVVFGCRKSIDIINRERGTGRRREGQRENAEYSAVHVEAKSQIKNQTKP